jgi:hypothetical protein
MEYMDYQFLSSEVSFGLMKMNKNDKYDQIRENTTLTCPTKHEEHEVAALKKHMALRHQRCTCYPVLLAMTKRQGLGLQGLQG